MLSKVKPRGRSFLVNVPPGRRPGKRDPPKSMLGNTLDFAERATKLLTLFVATIYIIGYVVTSTRLARYSVPATRLIDAQYFVAGLLPGLLLWLTVAVFASALHHASQNKETSTRPLNWVGVVMLILLVVGILMETLLLPRSKSLEPFDRSLMEVAYFAAKVLPGELALWFLVVGWRTGFFARLNEYSQRRGETGSGWGLAVFSLMLVAFALFQIIRAAPKAYDELPQAYGGGKHLRVELYVDRKKVPGEILLSSPAAGEDAPARTVALNLILQTSAEYVVDPPDDGSQRVWVLKADAVHAVHIVEGGLP